MFSKLQDYYKEVDWESVIMPLAQNALVSLVILVIGLWLARRLVKFLDKLMTMRSFDPALVNFLHAIIDTLLKFIVVLVAIEQLGVDTTSLLALLGAAGLAVGLALKDSLSNFASGVMLIVLRPFKLGDFVDVAGISGSVEKITVFSTFILTGDNKEIIVPNAQIYGSTITNYSARDTRRIDMVMGIGYEDDIKKARDVMLGVIAKDERVLKEKDPVVAVNELADSSVNFVVRVWVKTSDYWAVKWDLTEGFKYAFDENGISIPFPQQDVRFYKAFDE